MSNKKNKQRFSVADEEYMADHRAAFLSKSTFMARAILFTVIVLLIALSVWAYFGKIDQVTVGEGKVIPSSEDKVIQSLDGGIIAKIYVKEGDTVKPNQVLLKLDNTRYAADYYTGYQKYLTLTALVSRLQAEVLNQDKVNFPQLLNKYPNLIQRETKLFQTRRNNLKEELSNLHNSLETAEKELKMFMPLLDKGYVSNVQYQDARRNFYEVTQRILEKKNKYREEAETQLNQNQGELSSLTEQLTSLRDKMSRTTIVSPVQGIVKKIHVNTVGGVISPGMPIMDIVPIEDTLLIQARIKPSDIAFLKLGQPATVKITAYDYTVYGSLNGTVEYISADAIEEQSHQGGERPQSYYLVNIRTHKNYLGGENNKLSIIPGMMATVHIKTGKRTVMSYILKPILKAKSEALREK